MFRRGVFFLPPDVEAEQARLSPGHEPRRRDDRDATLDTTRARWSGRILTGVPVAFLAFDAAIKIANIEPVREAARGLGLPENLGPALGAILALGLVLHLAHRTAVLGAVLLTAYLGGAVAMHVRIGDPLLTHSLFPVYVAVLVWGGLYLRDPRVRALIH